MDLIEELRALVREIAVAGETEVIRTAAAAALDEPEFGALPALAKVIGGSRFAQPLITALAEAWNRGE